MKIALVTHKLSHAGGGVSAVVEALSATLDRKVESVRVLGLADKSWIEEYEDWVGAEAEAFPVSGPAALGWAPGIASSLASENPDLVHTHGIWMAPSKHVADWGQKRRRPYIISPHGMLEPQALNISRCKKRASEWLFEGRHLKGAHCLHALNTAEAGHIRAFGLPQPISIIPNGVALPKVEAPKKEPPWVGQFPSGARVLLFLSRLHPKKNLSGLICAISELKRLRRLEGWCVAVAGWGQADYVEKIKTLISDLDLNNEVALLGPVFGNEKDAALRHASAFILPSFSEGLPMAVLEAWAYGLPVAMTSACNLDVGFESGAAREIPDRSEDMVGPLADFLKMQDSEFHEMGRTGRWLVEQHFTWDVVADSFIELYSWILGEGSQPEFVR